MYKTDNDNNIGAVISGVVVPLLLIVIALIMAFVVLCVLYKKKSVRTYVLNKELDPAVITVSRRFGSCNINFFLTVTTLCD